MNSTINLRKLIPFVFLFFTFSFFSQKIDTVSYAGEKCFVYPFNNSIRGNEYYYNFIDFKKNKEVILKWLMEGMWKNLSPKELEVEIENFTKRIEKYIKINEKNLTKLDYSLKPIVFANPGDFFTTSYRLDFDVKPCLDKIPDGKYIQYFEGFPMLDVEGNWFYKMDKVSGVFTIKNNALNGEAMWFNFGGDTLKKGSFINGIKDGKWEIEKIKVESLRNTAQKEEYLKNKFIESDTSLEIVFYKNGIKNGFYSEMSETDYPSEEGYYTDDIASGHWIERKPQRKNNLLSKAARKKDREGLRHNKIITAEYIYADKKINVKQPIVRSGLIHSYNSSSGGYNFEPNYEPKDIPNDLFKIAFEEEVNLEMDDENLNSYEGGNYEDDYSSEGYDEGYDYEEGYDYDYEEGYDDYSFRGKSVYDSKQEKRILRGKAIDSLGLEFLYDGFYERHYPNGQLMFRYEFKDGKLLKEDTIFWDNGKPYDVVNYIKDSNIFIQSVYDYDGKLFSEIVFNSLGDFKRVNFEPDLTVYTVIEGYKLKDDPLSNSFSYEVMDTLETVLLSDSLYLVKDWNRIDTTKWDEKIYFPKDRILKYNSYSMSGKKVFQSEITFNQDYKSWTGVETHTIDNLTLKTTKSASMRESNYGYLYYSLNNSFYDSIPQARVAKVDYGYDVTSDNVICASGIPISGPVSITLNTKKAKLNANKGLTVSLPLYAYYTTKLEKDYLNYRSTGKSEFPLLLDVINQSQIYENYTNLFCKVFFPFLEDKITLPRISLYQGYDYNYDEEYEYEMDEEYESDEIEEAPKEEKVEEVKPKKTPKFKYDEKSKGSSAKLITGNLKDGKPEGLWTIKDQFGKDQATIPFLNGEMNGVVKEYSFQRAQIKPKKHKHSQDIYEENYYNNLSENSFMKDSLPKKSLIYMSSTSTYKNGVLNGPSINYNWLGEQLEMTNYVDGYKQGTSFERNKLAYTKCSYDLGRLDGYVQTYLTIPGKDSILLYDLNYKNGALQGESKSYHLNGKLSKRGFFLNGDPIDDYEAYDSLGFKYHYVKFLYSFPIEEKIWEENELSVLYTFDWKDSIEFVPSDITNSQTLDRMLARMGIGMDSYYEPYYGRPSLVEKDGIKYHMTKFYPNNTVSRDGQIASGKKVGVWKFYSYDGEFLYEVNYTDSIIKINDSISFKSKGLLTDYDSKGKMISKSFIIEKFEKYDCSHTDHYEIRQLYTIWEANDSIKRRNGYVKNHYDNGVLQNEGNMVDGLPSGVWKFYDPFGKLNQVGMYVKGKRDGRWLGGDISKTKYLGDICLNPNLPDLEKEIKMREQQLDIIITNYKLGKALNTEFFDIDWSEFSEEKEMESEGDKD